MKSDPTESQDVAPKHPGAVKRAAAIFAAAASPHPGYRIAPPTKSEEKK